MTNTAVAPAVAGDVTILREQAKAIGGVLRANTAGITHEESFLQPPGGGNCLNWIAGHLASTWDVILPLVGQEPVLGKQALQRYDRGTAELHDPAEALPLEKLLAACDEAVKRLDEGLAHVAPDALDRPAGFSPRNRADETVRSLLSAVVFHQAYHTGQTGLLRRLAGKPGAIR